MNRRTIILLLVLAVAAAAFFFKPKIEREWARYHQVKQQHKQVVQLQLGIARQKVRQLLGSPERVEVYPLGKNGSVEFLFYSGADEYNPIALESERGVVIGWGQRYYQETVSDLSRKQ